MQTQDVIKLLDEVLSSLEKASKQMTAGEMTARSAAPAASLSAPAGPLADAIDREIGSVPRQTSVVRVRGSEALERFRSELETESLTITTVTSLLQVVRQALQVFGILAA